MNTMGLPHQHKFYYVSIKHEFEPLDPEQFGEDIYRRIEYMYLMCNSPCNAVKKVVVNKEFRDDG